MGQTNLVDEGLKKSSNVGMLLLSWQFFLPQQYTNPLICIQPAHTHSRLGSAVQQTWNVQEKCLRM